MPLKHWFGLLAGAGAGIAIAWWLRRYSDYAEPATSEGSGSFGYVGNG